MQPTVALATKPHDSQPMLYFIAHVVMTVNRLSVSGQSTVLTCLTDQRALANGSRERVVRQLTGSLLLRCHAATRSIVMPHRFIHL
jgi:hypothetical protein